MLHFKQIAAFITYFIFTVKLFLIYCVAQEIIFYLNKGQKGAFPSWIALSKLNKKVKHRDYSYGISKTSNHLPESARRKLIKSIK